MPKLELSKKNIENLEESAKAGTIKLPDSYWTPERSAKGLGVRINRDASISWVYKRVLAGKQIWTKLGAWPDMDVDAAHDAAAEWRVRVRKGESPEAFKLKVMRWEDAVDRFAESHFPNLKPKTRETYASAFRLHIRPAFAGKLAHEINEEDVQAFHKGLGRENKKRMANVCLGLLNMIFERCEAWPCRPRNSNPVVMFHKAGYKTFAENIRDRPIEADEATRIGEALSIMESQGWVQFCNIARVLYYSGARRGEVLGLSWEWIDQNRKVIRWPDSKRGAISKPLNDELFKVLAKIPRIEGNPWVFPSQGNTKSKTGHVMNIERPWEKLLELAEIEDLTRHDFRHNFGNVAGEGETLQTVSVLLSHRGVATTERYSRPQGLPAANRLGGALKEKISKKPSR